MLYVYGKITTHVQSSLACIELLLVGPNCFHRHVIDMFFRLMAIVGVQQR